MPVQPFGKADPYYDALRVMSNQNIQGAALGDTGTGGVLENKIYLWPADGSTISTFDPTQAGMTAALAAWATGDVIWLPACTIPGNFTITQTVRGLERDRSILSGTIVLTSGAKVSDLTFTGNVAADGSLTIYGCTFSASVAPALTVTGILNSSPYIYNSVINMNATGASDYALVCTGNCYIEYCDILSLANAAYLNSSEVVISHSYFSAAGVSGSFVAVNLAYGRIANCLIESGSHGLQFSGGAATVTNTTMRVLNPSTKFALYVLAAGLILCNCSWNSQIGLTLATLLDGDRAKWNHTHTTSIPSVQPPVVVQYDNVGADYKVITDDSSYNAFPALVKAADGTLILIYRKGTTHANSKGILVKKTSTDGGLTWSTESTVVNDATYDARDPKLTRLANNDLILSYFLYNQTGPAVIPGDAGRIIISSDSGANWGSAITLTSGLTSWSVISAPILELANGDLLAPLYGQDIGDTGESSKVSKSTDGGATWTHLAMIADGDALNRLADEPNIVLMDDGTLLCVIRLLTLDQVTQTAAVSTSANSGATWSAITQPFDMRGNPGLLHLMSNNVIVLSRQQVGYKLFSRASADAGATWSDEAVLDSVGYNVMQYAQGVEIYPGLAIVAYGVETVLNTNADIRLLWIVEGGMPNDGGALVGSSLTVYGGDISIIGGGQFVSTTPTGTAPLVVASTTLVSNLNADMVDGLHASQLGHTIQDEGVSLTQRAKLNFVGDIVTATDDAGNGATVVTINSLAPISVYNETQSADGISLTYYLANYATPGTIQVYIDGIRQPASDDTVPTDIVSFGVAPDLGAVLLFDYEMDLL